MTYGWSRDKRSTGQNGFTVVEMLVVVVVVAILATITVVSYRVVTQSADLQTAKADVQNAASRLNKHKSSTGEYPPEANFANLGFADGAKSTFDYTYYSGTNEFCLSATYNEQTVYLTGVNTTPAEGDCS